MMRFLFIPRKGMTLIEVVIGLVLVSMMVVGFGVSLVAATYAQNIKYRNMAQALADEQLAVLQTYAASSLPIQNLGSLVGVLFSKGTWSVVADGTAPSAANAFEAVPTGASGLTADYPLPKNAYGNFTFSAKMKEVTGAPAGWQMGILFRSADTQNGYQLYLTATNLYLKKVVNGTATTLYSDARSISTNSWQTLGVVTNGSSIDIKLNGSTVTSVTDATYSVGKAALAAWGGGTVHYDDVIMDSDTWNFDTTAVSAVPDDWSRFGLASIPSGTATLTTGQLYGDADFVKATVNMGWNDSQGAKTLSSSVFLRN